MSNTGLIAFLFSEIFVGCDPSAVASWLMMNQDDASVRHSHFKNGGRIGSRQFYAFVNENVHPLHGYIAVFGPLTQDLFQRHARPYLFRRNAVHPRVSAVRYDKTSVSIEHAEALPHRVERRTEKPILRFDFSSGCDIFRNIRMRGHPTAIGHWLVANCDDLPARQLDHFGAGFFRRHQRMMTSDKAFAVKGSHSAR